MKSSPVNDKDDKGSNDDRKGLKLKKAYNGSSLANTRMDGLASWQYYILVEQIIDFLINS